MVSYARCRLDLVLQVIVRKGFKCVRHVLCAAWGVRDRRPTSQSRALTYPGPLNEGQCHFRFSSGPVLSFTRGCTSDFPAEWAPNALL